MRETTCLRLKVIEGSDPPNFLTWQENWDIIDAALLQLDTAIGELNSKIDTLTNAYVEMSTREAYIINKMEELINGRY